MKISDQFDLIERVDASRSDPKAAEVTFIEVYLDYPITSQNVRYPQTCVAVVHEGRLPLWLAAQMGRFRRIQKREDPPYGFVSAGFNYLGPNGYVANDPGDAHYALRAMKKAAERAGWTVREGRPNHFEAWKKEACDED